MCLLVEKSATILLVAFSIRGRVKKKHSVKFKGPIHPANDLSLTTRFHSNWNVFSLTEFRSIN